MLKSIEELIDEKNKSYGDSVGKSAQIMNLLFPMAILHDVYYRVHFMIRIFDKLSRLSSSTIPHAAAIDAWKDIAGYALLAIKQEEKHEYERLDDREDVEAGSEDGGGGPESRTLYTHGSVWVERS